MLHARQGNETAKRLAKDDKEGKVPSELFNHYTISSWDAGGYTQAAYAQAFPQEISAILDVFDKWVAGKRPPQAWRLPTMPFCLCPCQPGSSAPAERLPDGRNERCPGAC